MLKRVQHDVVLTKSEHLRTACPGKDVIGMVLRARKSLAEYRRSLALRQTPAANVCLVVASAVLTSLAFPPYELWPLAWIGMVPLLVALRRTSVVRASGWLALIFGSVFLFCTLRWMTSIFGAGVIGLFAMFSLGWVLFGLVYRLTSDIASPFVLMLITPVLWLAAEWFRCEGWYWQFPWAQLGFSQVVWRGGRALYPLVGVYGVTFLIVLVNAALAGLFDRRASIRWRIAPVLAIGLLVATLTGLGVSEPRTRETPVVARLVQDEVGWLSVLRDFSLRPSPEKPNLIVWPEYAIDGYPMSDPKLLAQLQDIARASCSTLVVGCKKRAPDGTPCDFLRRRAMGDILFYNIALLLGPDGSVLGVYRKTHPVQLFADGVPGTSYPTFETPVGRVGVAICYDFDFASSALNLTRNGAEILVVPTFDSMEWTNLQHEQHARIAQARAAEVGRWVVRATSSGVSQIISPSGLVAARIFKGTPGTIVGRAGLESHLTPYARGVYVLPKMCVAISVLWLAGISVSLVRRRNRSSI